MKELFKKTMTSIIASSVVAFIIGFIMAVAPGMSLRAISIIVGIYIIVHGVALIAFPFAMNLTIVSLFGTMSGFLLYRNH